MAAGHSESVSETKKKLFNEQVRIDASEFESRSTKRERVKRGNFYGRSALAGQFGRGAAVSVTASSSRGTTTNLGFPPQTASDKLISSSSHIASSAVTNN